MSDGRDERPVLYLDIDGVLLANEENLALGAKETMGDEQLRKLAAILVKRVRSNVTVDWTIRADAQARLRVEVKRLLREYGYPPDQEKMATELVLEQASLFGEEWSGTI